MKCIKSEILPFCLIMRLAYCCFVEHLNHVSQEFILVSLHQKSKFSNLNIYIFQERIRIYIHISKKQKYFKLAKCDNLSTELQLIGLVCVLL